MIYHLQITLLSCAMHKLIKFYQEDVTLVLQYLIFENVLNLIISWYENRKNNKIISKENSKKVLLSDIMIFFSNWSTNSNILSGKQF